MTNIIDEDGLEGSPWYIRAFVRLGMPTAFAAVLLWFLITNVTGSITHLHTNVDLIKQGQDELVKTNVLVLQNQARIIELQVGQQRWQQQTASVLSALCFNASNTDADRQRCLAALGEPAR